MMKILVVFSFRELNYIEQNCVKFMNDTKKKLPAVKAIYLTLFKVSVLRVDSNDVTAVKIVFLNDSKN